MKDKNTANTGVKEFSKKLDTLLSDNEDDNKDIDYEELSANLQRIAISSDSWRRVPVFFATTDELLRELNLRGYTLCIEKIEQMALPIGYVQNTNLNALSIRIKTFRRNDEIKIFFGCHGNVSI